MKLNFIDVEGNTPEDYLKAIAKSAGCQTEQEISDFLEPEPEINNPLLDIPEYIIAGSRLKSAIETGESITIYGDYDCDGITSIVQLIDLLAAAGHSNNSWFIPDRMEDNYGLTFSGLKVHCREQPLLDNHGGLWLEFD